MKRGSFLALWLYKALSCAAAPLFVLVLAVKRRRDPPYGKRMFELLGCYNQPKLKNSIWFHGASFGEINSIKPLLKNLSYDHKDLDFIVSTMTTTGAKAADELKSNGISVVYAPLDAPYALKGFFKRFSPSHLFIVDTELWPNMLDAAVKHNCQTCIVNARIQAKNLKKYLKYPNITRDLFGCRLNKVICAGNEDAKRFADLGVLPNRISVAGNLKYDLQLDNEKFNRSRAIKSKLENCLVLGAFSIHEDECQIVIRTYIEILKTLKNLKLVIVPRHKSGVIQTVKLLQEANKADFSLKSELKELNSFNSEILIGDTMGEMELYFGLSDLALMGGSFDQTGGHNPLEPAYFGLPIVTGPCFHNFKEPFNALFEAKGAFLIKTTAELAGNIIMLMQDQDLRIKSGLNAQRIQRQGQGALKRVSAAINSMLDEKN